ncbi:MAG TPA: hypothetical protein VIF15_13765 [Polyangiaceae bacterium]
MWRYEVRADGPRVRQLLVEARFAAGGVDALTIDDDAAPFVREVAYASGTEWMRAPVRDARWVVPCHVSGCVVRYRIALREAADQLDDAETAIASGDVVVAPPSTWLVHPDETPPGRLRFHVVAQEPLRFAAGTRPSPDAALDTYEAATSALAASSFAVFGSFDLRTVTSGGARVLVAIAPDGLRLSSTEVAAWVKSAVDAIAAYLGRFPAPRTLVVVQAGKGDAPTRGETLGDGGPAVLVRAAPGLTAAAARDDWVVTHELLHVSLPSLPHEQVWLSEGLPSYVEPLARARAGLLAPEQMWRDLVEGLPQGLPEAGDEGLDHTHTWGRTYWGGALFCLVADVRIREETRNARSLDDALRAVVATGADVETLWDVARMLDVGDRATGTRALQDLYRELALAPGRVDLAALWRRLGVRVEGDRVTFDDGAPLAATRRAIAGH